MAAPAVRASETAAKFLHEFYETYFQPLEKPLGKGKRFLYAFSGAFSLFAVTPFFVYETAVIQRRHVAQDPLFEDILPGAYTFWILSILLLSSFFAHLISWAETRHGPVRLYLSGVLLPASVVFIIRATWTFAEVAPATNQQ